LLQIAGVIPVALKDYKASTVTIQAGEFSFNVGHLTMADVAELRRLYAVPALNTLEAYCELMVHPGLVQRNYGAASFILEMADAIAHTIALATRQPDDKEMARNLPIGIQVRALIEILKLSSANEALGGATDGMLNVLAGLSFPRPEEIN
jgi:hypothetical protein